ncbi:oocyte zinc finger protein XlCOF7.1-like [Sabethes cyaneus]|uniref:oocyte zinc finger protein XlCOF7.1-like n=1 Tax=Sabethes cyaneus TaxID=53552 RepID=UPI00237E9A93|nr:oocyte zinc finger protein XlCOF7.1-like [Sabethes cyaneus]
MSTGGDNTPLWGGQQISYPPFDSSCLANLMDSLALGTTFQSYTGCDFTLPGYSEIMPRSEYQIQGVPLDGTMVENASICNALYQQQVQVMYSDLQNSVLSPDGSCCSAVTDELGCNPTYQTIPNPMNLGEVDFMNTQQPYQQQIQVVYSDLQNSVLSPDGSCSSAVTDELGCNPTYQTIPNPMNLVDKKPRRQRRDGTEPPKRRRPTGCSNSEFKCEECNACYVSKCGLSQHTKWVHGLELDFPCEKCGKNFSSEEKLTTHRKRHNQADKPYKCDQCTRQYMHKNDLKRHKYKHSNNAPFACNQCDKRFSRNDHLALHLRTHERRAIRLMQQRTIYRG